MLIPIRTDYRMSRRPWINYGLVATNVVLFILQAYARKLNFESWLLYPDAPRTYQFFTSIFLHGSWAHLIGNMIFLWVFGNALNDRFGHMGYLAFYLAGGVLAGLGYLLLSGHAPVLGASGAISAVTGAYLVLFPRIRVTLLFWFIYLLIPIEVSSLFFLMTQFIWNMVMSLSESIQSVPTGGVAYVAHSSGYLFGIGIAGGLLAARILPREPFDLLNLIKASRRRSRYRRMIHQGYDPFSYQPSSSTASGSRRVNAHTVEAAIPDTTNARQFELRRDIAEACRRHDLATAAEKYLRLIEIDEDVTLSRQNQLDVANQLMAEERYHQASDAYERFLKHYANYEYIADIHLMLGLIYGRYLERYDSAEELLDRAIRSLKEKRKLELARNELQAVRRRRNIQN